jgi:hypothetical protein
MLEHHHDVATVLLVRQARPPPQMPPNHGVQCSDLEGKQAVAGQLVEKLQSARCCVYVVAAYQAELLHKVE